MLRAGIEPARPRGRCCLKAVRLHFAIGASCEQRGSNPHGVTHEHLKLARLPFRHVRVRVEGVEPSSLVSRTGSPPWVTRVRWAGVQPA